MATYYVDTVNGNDTTGNATEGSPVKTLLKCFNTFVLNDDTSIVKVRGTIKERLILGSGGTGYTPTTKIVPWRQDEQVVWDGENTRTDGLVFFYGSISGKTVEINNITFRRHTTQDVRVDAVNNDLSTLRLVNCTFESVKSQIGPRSYTEGCKFEGAAEVTSIGAITLKQVTLLNNNIAGGVSFIRQFANAVAIRGNYITGLLSLQYATSFASTSGIFAANRFGASATVRFAPTTVYGSTVSITSDAQLNAKFAAEISAYTAFRNNVFGNITLDAYGFLTSEAQYAFGRQANNRRFASTATVAGGNYTPNPNFTLTSTYLERNTTDSATLVFTLPAIARARKVRRLLLHFERETPVLDENMGASGAVQLSFEPSLNGVDYLAPVSVKSGLIDTGGGVYAFDLLTTTFAKSGKVSVTLSGTVAGNIRLFGVSCEFYALEDLLTQAAGRLAINQLGPAEYGYFLVDGPYSADFDGVVLTARQVKDNAAITKTYADGPANTNIISLVKDGISYSTFEPQELIITGVRAVTAGLQANKKVIKEIEAPCDFSLKMVKFLNRFGVWDYILFYAKAETKANKSDSEYIETLNGYRNVGGDLQYQYRLFRNDFPNANAALLTDLDRNQNIWLANKWQISANKAACSLVGSGLTTYQRLVKFPLVSDAEYFEFTDRFAAGDSVSLISIDQQLSIWGTVTQLARVSPGVGGFMLIAFETPENETAPLFDLDAWIADELELFVVVSPAWEAVTFQNMTTVEDGHGQIFIELQLKGQPEAVYRV